MTPRYFMDGNRHLVCYPYGRDELHRMAADLGLKRCWFHAGSYDHYDAPKRRVTELAARCEHVDGRAILAICKGGEPPTRGA